MRCHNFCFRQEIRKNHIRIIFRTHAVIHLLYMQKRGIRPVHWLIWVISFCILYKPQFPLVQTYLPLKEPTMKTIKFAKRVDSDEAAHNELPHLDLLYLPSILWILNTTQLRRNTRKFCCLLLTTSSHLKDLHLANSLFPLQKYVFWIIIISVYCDFLYFKVFISADCRGWLPRLWSGILLPWPEHDRTCPALYCWLFLHWEINWGCSHWSGLWW